MKRTATAIIGATLLIPVTCLAQNQATEPTWPMFQRADVVTLAGKEIPEAFKRTKITDPKGKTVEGEWLVIDRKAQKVKFRRKNDAKEFEIPFANLCEPDRRYAELETGIQWDAGDSIPEPLNLIYRQLKDKPHGLVYNNQTERPYNPQAYPPFVVLHGAKISSCEIVGSEIKIQARNQSSTKPNDPFSVGIDDPTPVHPDNRPNGGIPLVWLTEADRALIKANCGIELPKANRPAWTNENYSYWKPIEFRFGKPMPKFDPSEPWFTPEGTTRGGKATFDQARDAMNKTFTAEEIFDHLRVKTLTSSFIFEYDEFWKGNFLKGTKREADERDRNHKPLAEVMAFLSKAELENESVSLKARIEKTGLKLFEENAPPIPPKRINGPKDYGPPIDGGLQALHFVAQYDRINNNKPKISYADVIARSDPLGCGGSDGRLGFYNYDESSLATIASAHDIKFWTMPTILQTWNNSASESLTKIVALKIVRQMIRNNRLVYSTLRHPEEGYQIITGFTLEKGKEPTYEVILLDGPTNMVRSKKQLPFKVSQAGKIEESKIGWSVIFPE